MRYGVSICEVEISPMLHRYRGLVVSAISYVVPIYQDNARLELPSIILSLRPSDAIWRHRSGSTLARIMACCLAAPSHYPNQC